GSAPYDSGGGADRSRAGPGAGRMRGGRRGRVGMSILIAEDDPVSSLILRRTLEGLHEEVVVAQDGESAWRIVRDREDIRVVVSDWMMPGIDGPDLCRRIRALEGRPYIYIILLTARTFREDRLAGLAAGADDFLTKPLDRA